MFIAKTKRSKYCSKECYFKCYYRDNKDKYAAKHKEYYIQNKELLDQQKKQYYQNNKESHKRLARKSRLKLRYNISEKQYDDLIKSQNWLCMICNKCLKSNKSAVDHDHRTGKIRGILCHLCNTSLGHFGDDIEGITKVVDYLIKTMQ